MNFCCPFSFSTGWHFVHIHIYNSVMLCCWNDSLFFLHGWYFVSPRRDSLSWQSTKDRYLYMRRFRKNFKAPWSWMMLLLMLDLIRRILRPGLLQCNFFFCQFLTFKCNCVCCYSMFGLFSTLIIVIFHFLGMRVLMFIWSDSINISSTITRILLFILLSRK